MALRRRTNSLAALMIALGLSTGFTAAPVLGQGAHDVAAYQQQAASTPDTAGVPACGSGDEDNAGSDDQDQIENQQGENEGTPDAADTGTDTSGNDKQDEEDSEGSPESEDSGNDQQGTNDTEDTAATPGALEEGQDLVSQAAIPLDQAVSTAQKEVQGNLGTVSLSDEDGTLVYSVEIGDQEVKIDAGDGSVIAVESANDDEQDNEDNCDEQDANATPEAIT